MALLNQLTDMHDSAAVSTSGVAGPQGGGGRAAGLLSRAALPFYVNVPHTIGKPSFIREGEGRWGKGEGGGGYSNFTSFASLSLSLSLSHHTRKCSPPFAPFSDDFVSLS